MILTLLCGLMLAPVGGRHEVGGGGGGGGGGVIAASRPYDA